MSTVDLEPEYARDRWCWPRPDDEEKEVDSVEIEVTAFGETEAEPACRICLEETHPLLESPCVCSGTQRWVHRACLRRWRMSAGEQRLVECEVCRSQYTDITGVSGVPDADPTTEERDAVYCYMSFVWALLIVSQLLSGVVLTMMLLLEEVNKEAQDFNSWSILLTMSTALNGAVISYIFTWDKICRWPVCAFILMQTWLVLWDYTAFSHGVSNVASGMVLCGVMAQRRQRRIRDDDDDGDDGEDE